MKRLLYFSFLLVIFFNASAQHCPWDCSGMIMLQINTPQEHIEKMNLVLVDEDKKEIIDTVYGTGKSTYDECRFLYYDDFLEYRTKRIETHYWYKYDTVYHFATGKYLVKFNFCKYNNKKIYLRYMDRYSRVLKYHYIEIPDSNRVHLHNYNNDIRDDNTKELVKALKPFVVQISCEMLGIRDGDCER
ncbi:MAG TPA: hypothetical protein PKC72_01745 [Chitinophagaceae bacterium]|nr:hypothetical protein [Chitinophagaceae bacterium]